MVRASSGTLTEINIAAFEDGVVFDRVLEIHSEPRVFLPTTRFSCDLYLQ